MVLPPFGVFSYVHPSKMKGLSKPFVATMRKNDSLGQLFLLVSLVG
jgi:hypothetical protein